MSMFLSSRSGRSEIKYRQAVQHKYVQPGVTLLSWPRLNHEQARAASVKLSNLRARRTCFVVANMLRMGEMVPLQNAAIINPCPNLYLSAGKQTNWQTVFSCSDVVA